jgi:hypothetical protein
MKARKAGLVVFWIGVVYMVVMGWLAGWWVAPTLRNLSYAEVGETIWALDAPLFLSWAFSVPLGAVIAGVGMMIYAGCRASRIWLFGVGTVSVMALIQFLPLSGHQPPVFGIVGGFILLSFIAMLWLWGKKRSVLAGAAKRAADYQLVGLVFFIIGMWYLCGFLGALFFESLATDTPNSPVAIILFLLLGWLFLLFGSYTETKALRPDHARTGDGADIGR